MRELMPRMCRRIIGGLLVFAAAAVVGAVVTPESASARGPCSNYTCSAAGNCTPEPGSYCHNYGWECFYGDCQL
jgi:hypothetical protein